MLAARVESVSSNTDIWFGQSVSAAGVVELYLTTRRCAALSPLQDRSHHCEQFPVDGGKTRDKEEVQGGGGGIGG